MASCLPSPTVEETALTASQGDLDALGALFDHYAESVVRYFVSRTQDRELALDLAGSTWEKVARSIGTYQPRDGTGGFAAWLFTVTRNTLTEHYRRRSRRIREELDGEMLAYDEADGAETPDAVLERKMDAQHITAELNGLPDTQRRCLTLRFFVGLSVSETADVMGKSCGAVKQMQLRGLRLLRKRLGDTGLGLDGSATQTVAHLPATHPGRLMENTA